MMTIFLTLLVVFLLLGLIPSFVSEEKLHEWVTKMYLSEKTNLDRIYDELNEKNYLVKDSFISEGRTLTNYNSIYYFVEPVTVTFDIDSPYSNCRTFKEFHNIDSTNLFALNGDIECQVRSGDNSKSVFLFPDTHKLKFKIESEEVKNEDNETD